MKDYKKLEERINKDKEITIASITELGYSRYDINQFIEAGILRRSKRGLYLYLPEIKQTESLVEPPISENEEVTLVEETVEVVENQEPFFYVNEGIKKVIKREHIEAINLFNKALELDSTNSHARVGLTGAYVFLNDYENAYTTLINFYNNRQDNALLYNIYYYLLLLKEHIEIDERLLDDIRQEIEENKTSIKKLNPNFKRLHTAINNQDYLEALKFANFSISIDKKDKKYHITNHIYKALIMSILKLKGIDPYTNIIKAKEEREEIPISQPEPVEVVEEQEVVVIPSTKVEDTIKTNLLLEAINSNNYDLALTLLEQEQIDNPLEVIKTLLTKLSTIKSLVTSSEPIKVISTEPVRVVEEQSLLEEIPKVEAKKEQIIASEPVVTTTASEVIEEVKPTPQELANLAYKAYKDAYHSEQFDEALRNLRRYEFLNNSNGNQRNVNYHRIRIEKSRQDFEQNPERYIKKKALARVIFDLKREKKYEAALAAIEEFKSLGGVKNELVILVEAEIYFALNELGKTSVILNGIRTSEEPTFFILSSKLAFRNYKFQDALLYCQAFNERRPNQSPANYGLMGDCYTKLGKSGKAIKAYRKAEEIAASYGNTQLDFSSKINKQEMIAEFKKEERDARSLGKKK